VNKAPHPWTTAELKILRTHARLGADEVAERLGRGRRSVEAAASRFGVSLRRRGERRGSVLGQPRGVSLRRDLRDGLLQHGDLIAKRLQLDADAELCPACGLRPARVLRTGFCRTCHLQRLAELQREARAEHEAQRELWVERQRRHRARQGVPQSAPTAPGPVTAHLD